MLLVVDPETFALNLMLLIGILVLLGVVIVVLIAVWTVAMATIWHVRQRRVWDRWLKVSRRADGRPYPPFTLGSCGSCGARNRQIYHLDSGEELCPACYEQFWRRTETPPPALTLAEEAGSRRPEPTRPVDRS